MAAKVVLVSLLLVVADACYTAADCSYSGACTAGRCACNSHWSGPNCTTLNLLPSPSADGGGLRRAHSSSWGGSVIWDDDPGMGWVMIFADMEAHCGLDAWQRNSLIAIATNTDASSPAGPFTLPGPNASVAPALVMKSFAHNPTAHGPTPGTSPVYLVYHIGDGHASRHGSPRTDCTNGTTPPPPPAALGATAAAAALDDEAAPPHGLPAVMTPNLLVAGTLSGPWTTHKWAKNEGSCNNPGAAVLKNGTVVLVCKVSVNKGPDGKTWRQMAIYVAPTWKGPYEFRRLTPVYGEDAYIWYSTADDNGTGAFHMLLHSMHPHKIPTTAWSKDGIDWIPNGFSGPPHPQPRASFNSSTFALKGGGTMTVKRRERHQPIFKDGKLVGLCNGVTTGRGDYSFTACVPVA